MICEICGSHGVHVRRIARTYGKGRDFFVIENIPIITCSHCGENYLRPDTLQEIERIKLHRKNLATRRPIPIVNFA